MHHPHHQTGPSTKISDKDRSPAVFPGYSENSAPEEAARIPCMHEWGKAGTSSGADSSRREHRFPPHVFKERTWQAVLCWGSLLR